MEEIKFTKTIDLHLIVKNMIKEFKNTGKNIRVGIEDVPSYIFEEIFDLELGNFSGWQCYWWGKPFKMDGIYVHIYGCAWYADATILVTDVEEI